MYTVWTENFLWNLILTFDDYHANCQINFQIDNVRSHMPLFFVKLNLNNGIWRLLRIFNSHMAAYAIIASITVIHFGAYLNNYLDIKCLQVDNSTVPLS